MCIAAAIAGAGVVGAIGSVAGAGEQASASEAATNAQEQMYNTQVGNLAPFREAGGGALSQLNYLQGIGTPGQTGASGTTAASSPAGGYGSLNQPFTASYMQQYSPAYQFQMQQGAQGTLNQAANTQGALSGSALSGLQAYNQQYANTAFNNAFNQYQTQQSNTFNRLSNIANLGEAAGANTATGGSNYAQGIGQSLTNTGTALGAGITGATGNLGSAATFGALLANQNSSSSFDMPTNDLGVGALFPEGSVS